ncbi:hypothetical protein QJQ58_09525 [Paenibacillus dendritiformis]|nr:hypothetical protein [Paenibacillus dendritiformis]WGU96449.1 hypothetical protein QJQ58_09525 [Paenibacillus dendritiformis]
MKTTIQVNQLSKSYAALNAVENVNVPLAKGKYSVCSELTVREKHHH